MTQQTRNNKNIKLPSKIEIIVPTIKFIANIDTKEKYVQYSSTRGSNTNHLSRGDLIQAANPTLTLKEARARGNVVYSSLQTAIDIKEKEALKKGWIGKLNPKNRVKKYEDNPISVLINETIDKYSTQGEVANNDSQLRTFLQNSNISKHEAISINETFKNLLCEQNEDIFNCWDLVVLYWTTSSSHRSYTGLDNNLIYRSQPECLLGNYLYLAGIPFKYEPQVKQINRIPDFKLLEHNTYIEVLMCDYNDQRRCAFNSLRAAYTTRSLMKKKEYEQENLSVEELNGDCSKLELYKRIKVLINKYYPNNVSPAFKEVRKFFKKDLSYLLTLTEKEITQIIYNAGGTAKFRNNKFPEYNYLENNYSTFSELWKRLIRDWRIEGQKRAVAARKKNSHYFTVCEHIDIIKESKLVNALGCEPWKNSRQGLYNAWISNYEMYSEIFIKYGVTKAPEGFKVSFFENSGLNNKNLHFRDFIK